MLPKSYLLLSLFLFLVFSSLFSSMAVPSTRSLKATEEHFHSSVQHVLTYQDSMDLNEGEEMTGLEKMFVVNGRMDLESLDYPGTGANNHHDPKTPGRA